MKHIILLHGAIGAACQLLPLSAALSKYNFKTHTLNFSGHGKASFQTNFGIEQFAAELEVFIETNNLIQPAVFGYSMGGYVALYLAHKKPGLLGTIITLGTKFEWSPEIAQKEIKMLDAKTILEKVPKFAEALKVRHGADWEVLLQKTATMMLSLGTNNSLNFENLSSIGNKALIGLADNDTMVSLNETVAAFKNLKQGNMYVLPSSKHPIESANINLLAKIIEDFIN